MNRTGITYLRLVVSLMAALLLAPAAGAATQYRFDQAVICCWMYENGACSTPKACLNGADVCQSENFIGLGAADESGNMSCGAMSPRGGDDDAIRLFVPPEPQQTADGETLEVSEEVANTLRTATQVMQLQRRGASKEELGAAIGDQADVSVNEADDGSRVITIRGEGADEIVLNFDAEGKLQEGSEE